MKETLEENELVIKKFCDKLKADIDRRVEAIKDHLDELQKSLMQTVESIKKQVANEVSKMNEDAANKIAENESFARNMERMLTDFEANKEQVQRSMYECQDRIDSLNCLGDKFRIILRKISFEPSDWTPDELLIFPNLKKFEQILLDHLESEKNDTQ